MRDCENMKMELSQNKTTNEDKEAIKLDLPFTVVNLVTTVLAFILPFYYYSFSSVVAFMVFYTITGLGLTMGYHRLFAHHSYTVSKRLEHVIACCGYLAIQRGPIFWVAMHRLHHKYSDVPGRDPHCPKEGIWHVHFGWLHYRRRDVWDHSIYKRLAPEYLDDRLYLWMDKESSDYMTYFLLVILSFLFGGLIGGTAFNFYEAICWLVWIGLLNRVALLHSFGLINSVCHMFGTRPFHSKDLSTNNFFVSLLIFGEGWHNNHHAFQRSARQGLKWYQFDPAWYVIWLLKTAGLAKDVYTPSRESIRKRKKI